MTRTRIYSHIPLAGSVRLSGILAACVLAGVSGCKKAPAKAPPPTPNVTVVRAEQHDIVEWDEYTGRLQAPDTVEIRSRVNGYLESVHFKDGQIVEKGAPLFTIDPRPYEAALQQAVAALEEARSQVALAEANFNRSQELSQKGVVSQLELDTDSTGLARSKASVAAAEARLAAARLDLGFTEVLAPIRGRISRNYVSVGNLVGGGSAGSTLLTTIVSLDPIYCYFEVDERAYLKHQTLVKPEMPGATGEKTCRILMELADETGFPREGMLNFVDNRLDEASATVQLRGSFPNPDLRLTPGLFARVRIPASALQPAVLVPDQAIGTDQDQLFAYVIGNDDKAEYRKIEVGPLHDSKRIVRSGLVAGERVVVSGAQTLRPGAAVKVTEALPGSQQIRSTEGSGAPFASPTPPKLGEAEHGANVSTPVPPKAER